MLAFRIALRYLFSKKSTNAINVITGVSMAGMVVGAFALIIVLSVFNGFEGLVFSLYSSFYPDLEVTAMTGKTFEENPEVMQKILKIKGVVALSRVLEENAYFEYGREAQIGSVMGVDNNYNEVTTVNRYVRQGDFVLKDSLHHYAVIGANISLPLNIDVKRPVEPLQITVPRHGAKTAFNPADAFNTMAVIPGGVFSIQQEFDSKYVFVSLDFARELLGLDKRITGYEIKLASNANMEKLRLQVAEVAGNDFKVKTRYEQKAETYRVMLIERWVTTAILAFIILIISFNIIGSLSMLVLEKSNDISILKTMGGTRPLVQRIYLLNGMLAALIGAGIGLLTGYTVCFLQIQYHFLKLSSGADSSFVINYYPVQLKWIDPVVIVFIIVAISLLAAYFPARRAGLREISFK